MLARTADSHRSSVALQACEFWLSLANLPACKQILGSHVAHLIQILLTNMRYSPRELAALESSLGADAHREDAPQSVPSRLDHDELEDEASIGWTLRKCSAASLDALALHFRHETLELVLPLLGRMLASEDDLVLEAGVLALGAIAEGCVEALARHGHLSRTLPALVRLLEHPGSLLRSIACWTLSRYSSYLDPELDSVLAALLRRALDENKRVQRAAVSALCYLVEGCATSRLRAHAEAVEGALLAAEGAYRARSRLLLYDAVAVWTRRLGAAPARLVARLVARFLRAEEAAEEFSALAECLASVAPALAPHAEPVYLKCLEAIGRNDEAPSAFDLLASLASALGARPFLNGELPARLYSALASSSSSGAETRRAALSLLGELVSAFDPNQLRLYVPLVVATLDDRATGANAAWSLGKMAAADGGAEALRAYAEPLVERLAAAERADDARAVALCELGLAFAESVASRLDSALARLACEAIARLGDRDSEEKRSALAGLCEALTARGRHPNAEELVSFCVAADDGRWGDDFELKERVRRVLRSAGCQLLGELPEVLARRMAELYEA